jgi:PAS domain S-box-containing protein
MDFISQKIWNLSEDLFCLLDKDYRLSTCNQAWTLLLGYSDSELKKFSLIQIVSDDDQSTFEEAVANCFLNQLDVSVEIRCQHREGSFHWIRWTLSYIPEKQTIFGIGSDVTETKRATSTLTQIEGTSKIGGWELDLTTKELYFSASVYKIMNIDRFSFSPNLRNFFNNFDSRSQTLLADALKTLQSHGQRFDFELPYSSRGQTLFLRLIGQAEFRETKVLRIFGTVQDVTTEKQIKDKLKESLERFDVVVNNTPIMLSVVNSQGEFEWVNQGFINELGWDVASMKGRQMIKELYPEAAMAEDVQYFMQQAAAGWRDFKITRRDGTEVFTSWANIKTSDGKVIGIGQNISKRKVLEDELIRAIEKLRLTLDSGGVGVFDFRPVENFVYYESGWSQLLGIIPSDINPHIEAWFEKIHPDDRKDAEQALLACLRGEFKKFEGTYRTLHSDGDWRWIHTRGRVTKRSDQGQAERFLAVAMDVTQQKRIENELSETLLRLELILQSGGSGCWDWNVKTGELSVDKHWCATLGLNHEEVARNLSTWESRVHPDDKAQAFIDLKKHMDGETPYYENIHRLRHADGRWLWMLDRGRVSARDADGQPIRFSGMHLDITELKETERQLREAQQVARIGNWSFNVLTGKIIWSRQLFEFFPENPAQGEPTFERHISTIHHEDRAHWLEAVNRCLNDGTPYKIRYRSLLDDRILWLEGLGRAVRDEQGKIVELYGTCQDITDRVQFEEENEFIIKSLNVGIWKFDPNDKSLNWGDSMFDLYGVTKASSTDLFNIWQRTLSPSTKEAVLKELDEALKGTREFETTFSITTSDGKEKHIGARAKVLRDSNSKPIKMFGMNWDRTNEKNLEMILEKERAKSLHSAKLASLGEMSAGIAHEINNPLAIISGSLSILEKHATNPEKFRSKIDTIKKATERISKIINGLRKFSRSTDVKEYKAHSIAQLVKDVMVLSETKSKRHEAPIEFEQLCDAKIHCDEIEIEQVLVNLVSNAIDAVKDKQERWVKIRLHEANNEVVLQVIDSGRGIPESIADKIFQPFFTTKAVGEGTGLGLSITKGILDEHKAKIFLNKDWPNTCMEIRFPKIGNVDAA